MSEQDLLSRITSPHQLRRLTAQELDQLANQVRARIIEVVSRQGGHLASNLGIAELTIALHHVFDFQHDRLLWDVGHQCYAHKLLTGRGQRFDTLRKAGGISGFPCPGESCYDLFATGHAGTAISTAAGLAWADEHAKSDRRVVAVVGDASIVNGLSLEGLNNIALLRRQFLVVLNDNSMAIDRTRGALAAALDRVRMTSTYSGIKQSAENVLHHLPLGPELTGALRNIKAGLRTTIHGGQMFEALGIQYFGPVDGHDIQELIKVLKRLAGVQHPVLLHIHTEKGRGCSYAVEDPCRFHSPPAYSHRGETAVLPQAPRQTWTSAFGKALTELAGQDERIVAITAAMPDGTGLSEFRAAFPQRYVDVGINESHALAMAGGLAKAGMRPVVAIYSTFMQRAFDQAFQEISLQNLPVLLCMDRAGLVGSDGAVHHGFADVAMLRTLPNMVLMAPADEAELKECMRLALSLEGPAAIRYPRDETPEALDGPCPPFELGKARLLRRGEDAAIVAYGAANETALLAADMLQQENLSVSVINARFAKPLDVALLSRLIGSLPVTVVEEHALAGGLGSAMLEMACARGLNTANVRLLGLPDRYIPHASRQDQLAEVGLDAPGIAAAVKDLVCRCRQARRATSKPSLTDD